MARKTPSEETLKKREEWQEYLEMQKEFDGIFFLRGRYSFKSPKSKRVWGHFEHKFIPAHGGIVELNLPNTCEGADVLSDYKCEEPTGNLTRRGNPEYRTVYKVPVETLEKMRVSRLKHEENIFKIFSRKRRKTNEKS
jgi:hypothetical protein